MTYIRLREKEDMETILSHWYLLLMLLGLPLAVWDGYFDITEVKTGVFAVLSLVYLLGRLACWLQNREEGALYTPGGWGEYCALGLCAVALLASVGSGYFWISVSGASGRWQGAAMLWIYAGLYIAFRSRRVSMEEIVFPMAAGLFLSALLAIFNHLGWDPMGMHGRLIPFDRNRYISTLGNINFAGAYLTLVLPVLGWVMLRTEHNGRRIALGAVCLAGLWAAMATRSDCTVLGLGAVMLLYPFLLRRDAAALRRWCRLWPETAAVMQLYRLAAWGFGARLSGLTVLLLHPAVSAAMALIGGFGYLLCRKAGESGLQRLIRQYAAALTAAAVLLIAALVLLNTSLSGIDLGSWDRWLRFSDDWGTDRVRIWKYCLGIYNGLPLRQKLLGGGCGILSRIDRVRRIFPDAVLDSAHCEYLQILLNWGVLGLAAYLGWLFFTARKAIKDGGDLPLALMAGLVGYAVQALVNIAQAPGICLFFVLLAVQHGTVSSGGNTSLKAPETGGKSAPACEIMD